jgi:alkanesulfonate monooxygenase SsuD/methylene tetrahydromethanopterin reductase-like flavin-dependent oxidoreductase (luciferase family)
VFVGENEEAARKGADGLMWYATSNKSALPFQVPPGYMPPEARLKMLNASERDPNALKSFSHEQLIENGIMFSGTPDQVYNQIKSFYRDVGGFGNLLIMGQAGFLGHKETVSSMKLFSEEVAPRLAELTAENTEPALLVA